MGLYRDAYSSVSQQCSCRGRKQSRRVTLLVSTNIDPMRHEKGKEEFTILATESASLLPFSITLKSHLVPKCHGKLRSLDDVEFLLRRGGRLIPLVTHLDDELECHGDVVGRRIFAHVDFDRVL